MIPPNGHNDGDGRLDRIERLLAESIVRNEAAHEEFEREHKRLLTAQVLFQENLAAFQADMNIKMAETTDKLNALIDLVNRHVSESGHGRSA
jgi:hypothetical protein